MGLPIILCVLVFYSTSFQSFSPSSCPLSKFSILSNFSIVLSKPIMIMDCLMPYFGSAMALQHLFWCVATMFFNLVAADDPISPDFFQVQFDTNVVDADGKAADPIIFDVTRSWAPYGADRFYALVNDSYYNEAVFFRVVPDFVVQFGIAADPEETAKWDTTIPDDPVIESNLESYVTFATAGPDTRTTQLFINYIDNSGLDDQGFAPFAKVSSGMDTANMIVNPTPGNSNGINQAAYTHGGNAWLLPKYPNASLIIAASFI